MTDTLLDRLRAGGIEEQEAAIRIAELEEARAADNHWIIDLQEINKNLEARAEAADRDIEALRNIIATKDEIYYQAHLKAEADAARLRKALEIYAKPENWTPHKTRHRRIWIYHCYEDGFKIAQAALLLPEQPAAK